METYSSFEKQLMAFENMIKPLIQIEFDEKFFLQILEEISIPKIPMAFSKENTNNDSTAPIHLLRELSFKMRKRIPLSTKNKEFLDKLSLFLKQYQFATSLKRYFDEKIYSSVYLYCYDPFFMNSTDDINSKNFESQQNIFLTEIDLGHFQDLECKHHIKHAEDEMFLLTKRWNALLNENNVDLEHFEKDTKNCMKPRYHEMCLYQYIFSDLYLKSKLSLKIVRDWISNYKKISKNSEKLKHINQYSENIIKQIVNLKINIENQQDDIKKLNNLISNSRTEFESFKEKENLILKSINNKQDLIHIRDSLEMEYKDKLSKRESLITKLNQSVQGTSKHNSFGQEINHIETIIDTTFQDLKILNYSVFLAQEDSLELASSLKDYIRWTDSSEQILHLKEKELEKIISQKQVNEDNLIKIYENIKKIKSVVGSKIDDLLSFDNDKLGNLSRPFSSKTYTIDGSNCRFKDMNEAEDE